jgi:predicted NBD/HSP70 family sugar kinase
MFLVLDIGGTNCRIAVFNSNGAKRPLLLEYLELEQNLQHDWQHMLDLIEPYRQRGFTGAVIGVAGALNAEGTTLINSPHLHFLEGIDLKNRLQNDLNCPVSVFNDTYLATLAETKVSGRSNNFWYLNWGSGIGGSLALKGKKGWEIHNAEPGHMVLDPAAAKCECGQQGCWDIICGGRGLIARFNKHPSTLILAEWKQIIPYMTQGILNLSVVFPVGEIIMGGGIAINQPEIVELINQKLNVMMKIIKAPKLSVTKYADLLGIYGGFHFLKEVYNISTY